VLQVDGYVGFERLTAPGDIVLAARWAHYLESDFIWSRRPWRQDSPMASGQWDST
jgi:hypothetical protein